ncbi:MAG: hypothetical protein ACM31L_10460 [Actinomycetota bacterium]
MTDDLEGDFRRLNEIYDRAIPSPRLRQDLDALARVQQPRLLDRLKRLFASLRANSQELAGVVPLGDGQLDAAVAGTAEPGLTAPRDDGETATLASHQDRQDQEEGNK